MSRPIAAGLALALPLTLLVAGCTTAPRCPDCGDLVTQAATDLLGDPAVATVTGDYDLYTQQSTFTVRLAWGTTPEQIQDLLADYATLRLPAKADYPDRNGTPDDALVLQTADLDSITVSQAQPRPALIEAWTQLQAKYDRVILDGYLAEVHDARPVTEFGPTVLPELIKTGGAEELLIVSTGATAQTRLSTVAEHADRGLEDLARLLPTLPAKTAVMLTPLDEYDGTRTRVTFQVGDLVDSAYLSTTELADALTESTHWDRLRTAAHAAFALAPDQVEVVITADPGWWWASGFRYSAVACALPDDPTAVDAMLAEQAAAAGNCG